MEEKSLGLVTVPERTFEHDLALLGKFQEFSAELLRVALIGISAIGFVVSRIIFPEKSAPAKDAAALAFAAPQKWLFILALFALTVSAGAALAHRFYSADSASWHLQAMRRYARNMGEDSMKADSECQARYKKYKASRWAVACSAIALGVGTVLLVAAIIISIW